MEFYGFAGREMVEEGVLVNPTQGCMLVQILGETKVQLDGLPPNVVALDNIKFTYNAGGDRSVTLRQFPVILAYAITDYKCQGQTYQFVIVDLKKPSRGGSPSASIYVQLSRCRSLSNLSIMRPFDPAELRAPLSEALLAELAWEERMDEITRQNYI